MAATGLGNSGFVLLAGALLLVLNPLPQALTKKTLPGMSPTDDLFKVTNRNSGICRSKDLRNTLNSLNELKGCRVVEGFVQILLFDNVNESSFENYVFPDLVEITDFLLLYRVNGLRSIGQLFPNLAVIRGQDNVFGYSFIVYEMSSLQEIGLYSLTNITSGLIRIDKNPSLCYVNSIDWQMIAHEKGQHFIKNIKADNECPLCRGDDSTENPCPVADNKSQNTRHLCWNRQHCQKICPDNCIACDSKGKCCDEKCLGGCSDYDPKACHVCRNFSMEGRCMDSCPNGRYEFLERRCITREECINAVKPLQLKPKIQHEHPYKIFQNKSCVLGCPSDYTDDYVKHTCEPCDGRCTKECQGTVIDSLLSAQQLRGCTHINGSLEIQIRGGRNVVTELEENLSMIEEIDGYLKIVRSFPLVSLNFFKKLKYIRGNSLESQKYVFIVLDNQNLQDIWDWKDRTLRIDHGRLFFHFNPRLCMNKIEKLRDRANLSMFTNLEVAPNSNGDKIACDVQALTVNISTKHSKSIVLTWAQFQMKDHRKLLGYVVYTIESPFRNITLYDGRDACGGDGWRVDDVPLDEDKNSVTFLLSKLKPYTQYAFYVKTYTIASELSGAQSAIDYFRTLADQPSLPTDIKVVNTESETLYISWSKPGSPNGNITHYIVIGTRREEEVDQLRERNYCNSTQRYREMAPKIEIKTPVKQNNTCECMDFVKPGEAKRLKNATDVSDQITFEDRLYNFVYIKRVKEGTRKKRHYEFPESKNNDDGIKNNTDIQNKTDTENKFTQFKFNVSGTHLVVNGLRHYTAYDIKVQACREKEGEKDDNFCSAMALQTVRTEKKAQADTINNISINQTLGSVTVIWDKPSQPNGHILTYEIEYQMLDIDVAHATPYHVCISAFTKDAKVNNTTFTLSLSKRNYGNYSLRMSARSQAGLGEWSDYVYFYIEEPSSKPTTLIAIVVTVIFFLLIVLAYYVYRRKYGPPEDIKLIASVNPEYVSTVYEPDDWEVPRDKIKLLKELGQGSFGMVYEGSAKDVKGRAATKCAIKTVNEHATNRERIEFLNEASVMKAFDTAHVVRLLGVVSQGQPTLVVMELMANGDLKSYLRSHRPDIDSYDKTASKQPPTLKRILQMAVEIADGMAYLSAKKFVHRDLAARNCMVAEDLTVKIGDFGMTRDIYETDYYRKGTKGLLPVRWMAPESLKDGVFTSNSDVWSYGVVLWEMATLASQPYQGLSNDQVLRYVIDGGIMERPENCPDKLYDLMMCCWRHKPSDRPNFLNLCCLLLEDASNGFCQVSFYHSAAGMEARNSRPSQSPSQDDPSTPLRGNQIDENFSLTSSDADSEQELEVESNIDFTSYPSMTKDVPSTANGYVSTRASNGTTT